MNLLKMAVMSIVLFVFITIVSAADLQRGKVLFADPKLGGGNLGISCNSCHPEGKGLELATNRENIKEIVNHCIKKDMDGTGITLEGEKMTNLVAYIGSLKGKVAWYKYKPYVDCTD